MASRGSIFSVTTQVSVSSWPMWTWKLSGGSPPSMRVLRTALALGPAPPATVALTISTPGFCFLYGSTSWFRAADPPRDVHHEKISRRPAGAALIAGAGAAAAGAVVAAAAGAVV